MKKVLPAFVVASTILTSQAVPFVQGSVYAAQKEVTKQASTTKAQITVDGVIKNISMTSVKGHAYYSVTELSHVLGLKSQLDGKKNQYTITKTAGKTSTSLKINSKTKVITLNNKKVSLGVTFIKNTPFVDVKAFAGFFQKSFISVEGSSQIMISSNQSLKGDFYSAQQLAGNKLLITGDQGENTVSLIINPMNLKVEKTLPYANLQVAPNGVDAMFVDEDGFINTINLNTNTVSKFEGNDGPKANFVWSADNKKIYFTSGDKNQAISVLDLTTKAYKDIVTDNVNYKADIVLLSEQPLKISYTVVTEVVAGGDDQTDIDDSKAGQNVYVFDDSKTDSKITKLTDDTDNKLSSIKLPNGDLAYLSQSTVDENANPKLVVQNHTTLAANVQLYNLPIEMLTTAENGQVIVVVAQGSTSVVYELQSNGLLAQLFKTSKTIDSIDAKSSKQMTFTYSDGEVDHVAYVMNGKVLTITK